MFPLFAGSDRGMTAMTDAIDMYLRVREREGRLYPDDVVRQLPTIPPDHPLFAEWQARAASCDRLTTYLTRFRNRLTVLELGCGNGWLANRIAAVTNASVVGLDLNRRELHQAQRLFAHRDLSWVITDIACAAFDARVFDVVVIASAIQYFADLPALLKMVAPFLKKQGEIHILDSPLYSAEELPAARERSRQYYSNLGFPEMAAHYHHHASDALAERNATWLYVPRKAQTRAEKTNDSPFPWVRVRPAM
jgi:ubiquinone/menaquinone biosynthesis C-methylase UbiE